MRSPRWALLILLLAGIMCACTSARQNKIMETNASSIQLRSIQTRVYDITDENAMLRAIIATLQDLAFIIDNVDADLGMIAGRRHYNNWTVLRLTVSIKPKGMTQLMVRSSAQFMKQTIEDPLPYQQFFTALSQNVFRDAHQVP